MTREEAEGRSHSHGEHRETDDATHPRIDEGMRRWYASCPCCMSAAYPEIKQALDEERWASPR